MAFQLLNAGWLLAFIVLLIPFIAIGAINATVLTRALEPKTSYRLIIRSYLRSFALGLLAFGKLGELTFAHYLAQGGGNYGLGLAVLVFDKMVTFALISTVGCVGLFLYVGSAQAGTTAAISGLLFAVAVAVLAHPGPRMWVRTKILRAHEGKFKGFSSYLLSLVREHHGVVGLNILLTILRMVLSGLSVYVGFMAFGVHVDLLPTIVISAIIQLISWIPITLSGLGLTHGAATLLFSVLYGLDKEVVLNVYVVGSVAAYCLAALLLFHLGYGSDRDWKNKG